MNAFVKLDGSFPERPVPAQPVLTRSVRLFLPTASRWARARAEVLRVKNSDNLLHNVHSSLEPAQQLQRRSAPAPASRHDFKLADEEMLKIGCDVHRWMTAWVGVVDHPYFAVTGADGSFYDRATCRAGKRTISVWHEKFGTLTKTVDVKPGAPTTVGFRAIRRAQRPEIGMFAREKRCQKCGQAFDCGGLARLLVLAASSWTPPSRAALRGNALTASARPAWLGRQPAASS